MHSGKDDTSRWPREELIGSVTSVNLDLFELNKRRVRRGFKPHATLAYVCRRDSVGKGVTKATAVVVRNVVHGYPGNLTYHNYGTCAKTMAKQETTYFASPTLAVSTLYIFFVRLQVLSLASNL